MIDFIISLDANKTIIYVYHKNMNLRTSDCKNNDNVMYMNTLSDDFIIDTEITIQTQYFMYRFMLYLINISCVAIQWYLL
jgi:hypothetical protein